MIINLCPHSIKLETFGVVTEYPSAGIARVEEEFTPTGIVDGVVEGETKYGEITGLPAPAEGVLYVASIPVRDAAKALGRSDVRIPKDTVRDPKTGFVLYAKAISR